jgi:hypothetical protein
MALIPKPETKKRFDPPLVIYNLAPGEDPRNPYAVHIRRTFFYYMVDFCQETGLDQTSLSSGWTDEQIRKGAHLPFIDESDCPAERREERAQRVQEWDAMSVGEKLSYARQEKGRT